jgi:hypothetical protein
MEQVEKHLVVDVVLELSMLGVVVLLGVGLSLEQTVPYLSEESVTVSEESIHCLRGRRPRCIWQ